MQQQRSPPHSTAATAKEQRWSGEGGEETWKGSSRVACEPKIGVLVCREQRGRREQQPLLPQNREKQWARALPPHCASYIVGVSCKKHPIPTQPNPASPPFSQESSFLHLSSKIFNPRHARGRGRRSSNHPTKDASTIEEKLSGGKAYAPRSPRHRSRGAGGGESAEMYKRARYLHEGDRRLTRGKNTGGVFGNHANRRAEANLRG